MKSLFYILLVVSTAVVRAWALDAPDVDTVQGISIMLVSEDGRQALAYPIPTGPNVVKDLLFKPSVDERMRDYSWAVLEVSDPSRNLVYRLRIDGQLPPVIHWDGYFNEKDTIDTDQRYFVRLLLHYPDKQVFSSPWSFFSTRLRTIYDDARKVKGDYISLYIIPTGGLHTLILNTPDYTSVIFPNVYGDVSLIWKEKHTIMLKLEATSNILFNFDDTKAGVFYSDVSLYYKYRLAGAPIHAPLLPANPPFGTYKYRVPSSRSEVYGRPFNSEVGVHAFYTTIRGAGNRPIDAELARRFQGLSLLAEADHTLGEFRIRGEVEAGYSVFQGNLWTLGLDTALTYERFETVAPGLQLRYNLYAGTPSHDPYDGTLDGAQYIANHVILAGVVMYFKL